jgi:hypothetical protein
LHSLFFYLYNQRMKSFLDRFILGIPHLYIKQFPYAWIAFIALWTWPTNLSIIFLLIVLIGLFMLKWQYSAWISTLRNEYAPKDGKFYIDRPPVPIQRAVRNILILCAATGLVSYFLSGQVRLTSWQLFLTIVGFSLLYRNSLFFGAPTTYIITASGIAIRFAPGHLDYCPFLKFDEISRIERCEYQKDKGWDSFARLPYAKDGLLLIPKNPKGFTKRVERLFIVPKDIDKFQEQLPYGYK